MDGGVMDDRERQLADAILDAAGLTMRQERELAQLGRGYEPGDAIFDARLVSVGEARRRFAEALAAWFAFKVDQCGAVPIICDGEVVGHVKRGE